MINALRAELRKVLTVRSTYLIAFLCFGLVMLFAFYGEGIRFSGQTNNPYYLQNEIINAVNALALFIALIGVLLITHEYRYNTIMYTLTASNSRTKSLLAKVAVVSCYALVLTVLFGALSPLMTALGLQIKGVHLVHQVFNFHDIWWRVLLYGWGYAMYGFILAITIRNQIGSIVPLFLIQATVEPLLGIVLKDNVQYLPFNAINKLLSIQIDGPHMSYTKPAITVGLYIAVGLIISWLLFIRRDAN
jgi:ABC-type transport system involved in multi-copper enzyme maturation permease subunit